MYQLIFDNGKAYIGITSQELNVRVSGHITASKNIKIKTAIASAIRKHGICFKRKVLAIGKMDYLQDLEVKAIESFNTISPGGYNLSYGGEISPALNPFVANKISASSKGKIISKSAREKMALAKQGIKLSDSHRAKISASGIGRKKKSESIEKMIATRRENGSYAQSKESIEKRTATRRLNGNYVQSSEAIKKMLATKMINGTNKLSEETKKKLSEKHMGKVISQEQRKKISDTLKARNRLLKNL